MRRLAEETGGSYFVVTKDLTPDTVYSRIEESLRNQYSLGYTPEKPPVTGQYRSIILTQVSGKVLCRRR